MKNVKKVYDAPECSVTSVLIKTGICGSDPFDTEGNTRETFVTWENAGNSEFTM